MASSRSKKSVMYEICKKPLTIVCLTKVDIDIIYVFGYSQLEYNFFNSGGLRVRKITNGLTHEKCFEAYKICPEIP